MSPREAMYLDPQQRLLMEVTWEALERAGLPAERLAGSHTGVFIGVFNHDYVDLQLVAMGDGEAQSDAYFVLGGGLSFAAGRISYQLGLHGPAMVIDTACSSSLVALHVACQSLRADECEAALVGGVTLDFSPYSVVGVSKIRALSPTGRSRTLDESADGFVRGEGCGVVVLKRLSRALADGDPVLAVIRGSAVNHDGRSSGLTAPNGLAQQDVERRALRASGVAPEHVGYIEIHGTGTPLGDPIEFEALKAVYGNPRPDGSALLLGSVKTNIGHLEPAAGVAALVKTILALQHREIPPHANFETLNPRISLAGTPFEIPRRRMPFPTRPAGQRLLAAVGGAGLSGTNAHVLLEEAPLVTGPVAPTPDDGSASGPVLVPLSARDPVALRELAATIAHDLDDPESELHRASLRNIAFTAANRRTHHPLRVGLVASDHESLAGALRSVASGVSEAPPQGHDRPLSPVFVFSGQGGQWTGMGVELLEHEAVFRDALEHCDAALRPHTGWSVIDELRATEARSRLHLTEIAQPAIWAVQLALAALWRSWGMTPGAVVGHSVGEIAAAYAAGVLDLDQSARLVAIRGRVMEPLRGQGGMAAVELPEIEAAGIVALSAGRISIAAVNSPTSVVLSGEMAALEEALSEAQRRGVFFRRLAVEYPFHSTRVEAVRAELVGAIDGLSPRRAVLPLASTVTGGFLTGDECDSTYWGRNLVQGVRFGDAVSAVLAEGFRSWIEVGPHPALLRNIQQSTAAFESAAGGGRQTPAVFVPSLRNGVGEREVMLGSLGTLYSAHHEPNWPAVGGDARDARVVALPTYPWQRRRYWFGEFDPRPAGESRRRGAETVASGHPLFGSQTRTAGSDARLTGTISAMSPDWVGDHRVAGTPVIPAAAFVEALLAAAGEGSFPVRLLDVIVRRPLVLSGQDRHLLELVVGPVFDSPERTAQIASCPELPGSGQDRWTVHATARITPDEAGQDAPGQTAPGPGSAELGGDLVLRPPLTDGIGAFAIDSDLERVDLAAVDARLAESGLEYGPAFDVIREAWRNGSGVTAWLELPDGSEAEAEPYVIHPILLDAAFRVVAATGIGQDGDGSAYLPVGVDEIRFLRRAGSGAWCRASVRVGDDDAGSIVADLQIATKDGQPVGSIAGLRLRRVSLAAFGAATVDPIDAWWYGIDWGPSTRPAGARASRTWLIVSDEGGLGPDLAVRLRAEGDRVFLAQPGTSLEARGADTYALDIRDAGQVSTLVAALRESVESTLSIAFLPALDAKLQPTASSLKMIEQQRVGGAGLLNFLRALDDAGITAGLRVVTRGSQYLDERDHQGTAAAAGTALAAAPIWSLGWAAVLEQPGARGSCIDLDPAADDETSLSDLVHELEADDEEDQVVIRAGRRFVARLARRTLERSDEIDGDARPLGEAGSAVTSRRPPLFDPDGTCLITGGLGGIGLELARLAGARGAGAIALVGRGEPSVHALDVIGELRQAGSRVWLGRGDIAEPDDLGRLLAAIERELPPLRTVIHAAGVVDDGVLVTQDWPRLRAVLAPKLGGAWNLHRATERNRSGALRPIFLSRVAPLFPGPGNVHGSQFLARCLGRVPSGAGPAGDQHQLGSVGDGRDGPRRVPVRSATGA